MPSLKDLLCRENCHSTRCFFLFNGWLPWEELWHVKDRFSHRLTEKFTFKGMLLLKKRGFASKNISLRLEVFFIWKKAEHSNLKGWLVWKKPSHLNKVFFPKRMTSLKESYYWRDTFLFDEFCFWKESCDSKKCHQTNVFLKRRVAIQTSSYFKGCILPQTNSHVLFWKKKCHVKRAFNLKVCFLWKTGCYLKSLFLSRPSLKRHFEKKKTSCEKHVI